MSKARELKDRIMEVKSPVITIEVSTRSTLATWLESSSTNNHAAAFVHDVISTTAIKESVNTDDIDNYNDLLNKISDDGLVTIVATAQDKGFTCCADEQPEEDCDSPADTAIDSLEQADKEDLEESDSPYDKAYAEAKKLVDSNRQPALKKMFDDMSNGDDETEAFNRCHFGAAQDMVKNILKKYGIAESLASKLQNRIGKL